MKRKFDSQMHAEIPNVNLSVLDLNDDCFLQIFGYLNLFDLCAVADTCNRFRENAQARLSKVAHKDLNLNSIFEAKGMRTIFNVVRHTGAFPKSIEVDSSLVARKHKKQFEIRIIESISRYCNDQNMRLTLTGFDGADEIVKMLPHRVVLQIVKSDSTWTRISDELDELIQDYPHEVNYSELKELEVLSIKLMPDFHHALFEMLLETNPRLKEIEVVYCNEIDDRIFPLIAARAPQIESLRYKATNRLQERPSFDRNTMALSKLTKLKTLDIDCEGKSFIDAIQAMTAAKSQLENLQIVNAEVGAARSVFVDRILQFQNLKSLSLFEVRGLERLDLIRIAENLVGLTEIQLNNVIILNAWDVVQLVRSAKELRYFYYRCILCEQEMDINDQVHTELVAIAADRGKKMHLKLCATDILFPAMPRAARQIMINITLFYETGLTLVLE